MLIKAINNHSYASVAVVWNISLQRSYRKLRNEIQRDIDDAKSNHIKEKLEENMNKPKTLWQNLKSLGYSGKNKAKNNIVLRIADKLCFDTLDICNYINNFFTTIASKLVHNLPTSTNKFGVDGNLFKNFYREKGIQPGALKLTKVNTDFVSQELSSLNSQKATGLDGIAPKFLKDSASIISPVVTHIINLSIATGKVPDELKLAKVTPLYKKNDKLDVGNYRPVSVLSVLSKVLEKAVYTQLHKHLNENGLIYQYQSGFRPGHSTETCLIYLTDYIKRHTAQGLYTGMLLLDVQKAFDSVNHHILCDTLYAMGVDPTWFRSYLTGRKQTVSVNGVFSEFLDISCGVPQGSLLGPLLYLCYSNGMVISVSCKLLLYADDSVLIVSHSNPDVISKKLSTELEACNQWLIDNKLSLHVGKTECIIFGSKRKINKVN